MIVEEEALVYRLRMRASIRRQIVSRKSVQEGKPDRIADILEEAANEIERLQGRGTEVHEVNIDKDYLEVHWSRKNSGWGVLTLRLSGEKAEFDSEFMGREHVREVMRALANKYPLGDVPSE